MITICASPMQTIRLGRVGENERQRVAFDVSALLAELPGASFTIVNQGPGDVAAYPCPGVTVEDGVLYWPITSAELKATGRGRCELIVTVGDTVAKSVIYATQVLEALDGSGDAPEPWDSWQTEFAGMVADAQEAAAEATESALAAGVDAGRAEAAAEAVERVSGFARVSALSGPALLGPAIEAAGIPAYIKAEALSDYSDYGLTAEGWYVFARIAAPEGVSVTEATSVTGAAGAIIEPGADHIDVAVRFGVAAESVPVTVSWSAAETERFVFKATDLAVRNLDYRTTFYIYDIARYATWEYALTADTTFAEGKRYYTEADGVYTLAEVTAGEAVPAETYYNHSKLHFEGMVANVTYRFDETVDCPIEIVLPVVAEDGHGAWFEIQMRYNGSYSCTLLPPEGVKIGTAQTQAQTEGVNTIDLQYTDADDVKMWTLLNTHSNIPTA